jgi:DNA-binding CsgD family transcriptional regulator
MITFTQIERELLLLLCEGKSNKEIVFTTQASIETVASRLRRLRKKLRARNRTHLIARYYQWRYEDE